MEEKANLPVLPAVQFRQGKQCIEKLFDKRYIFNHIEFDKTILNLPAPVTTTLETDKCGLLSDVTSLAFEANPKMHRKINFIIVVKEKMKEKMAKNHFTIRY